jgi:hypothetical protein
MLASITSRAVASSITSWAGNRRTVYEYGHFDLWPGVASGGTDWRIHLQFGFDIGRFDRFSSR